MKNITYILSALILLCPLFSNAQKVTEGKIKLGKSEASGFIATSKYNRTQVGEAITAQLEKAGLKKHGKKKKFYSFTGVEWQAISPNKIDLYYKVQKKKRKSKIYFIVSKGYDNYVTSANDAPIATNITNFLGQIDAMVDLNEDIKNKEEQLKLMNEKLEKDKAAMQKAEAEKKQTEKQLQQMKTDR